MSFEHNVIPERDMDVGPHLAMFQLSVNPSCEVFFVLGDFFLPREELC